MDNKTVVIGAGEMGHGIAQSALMAGFEVTLFDINEEGLNRGKQRIEDSLNKLFEKERITKDVYDFSKQHLRTTTNFSDAVRGSKFVFEAVPEIIDIKESTFKLLEENVDSDTVLASNTSNMSISKMAKHLKHPERVVGIHFFNPVVLMKLVEVIKGEYTSEEVMQEAINMCEKMNKVPVRLEKDTPAFIVNRINGAARTFLGALVDKGVETPERIDARLRSAGDPMGHFELNDFIGLDTVYNSSIYRQETLHDDHKPSKVLSDLVEKGQLGRKTTKGFYDWSKGRPDINLEDKADEQVVEDIKYIKLNEASKLVEQDVATAKDIDLAMTLGTGDKLGPFAACKDIDTNEIAKRLEELSTHYKLDIISPTEFIKSNVNQK